MWFIWPCFGANLPVQQAASQVHKKYSTSYIQMHTDIRMMFRRGYHEPNSYLKKSFIYYPINESMTVTRILNLVWSLYIKLKLIPIQTKRDRN